MGDEIIAIIEQILAEHGEPERGYTVEGTTKLGYALVVISYISSIKYDSDPDPRSSHEPKIEVACGVLSFPADIVIGELHDKVLEWMEKVERKDLIVR